MSLIDKTYLPKKTPLPTFEKVLGDRAGFPRSGSDAKTQKAGQSLLMKEGALHSKDVRPWLSGRVALYGALTFLGIGAIALALHRTAVFPSPKPQASSFPSFSPPLNPEQNSSSGPSSIPNSDFEARLISADSQFSSPSSLGFDPNITNCSMTESFSNDTFKVLNQGALFHKASPLRNSTLDAFKISGVPFVGLFVGSSGFEPIIWDRCESGGDWFLSSFELPLSNQSFSELKEAIHHQLILFQEQISTFGNGAKQVSLRSLRFGWECLTSTPQLISYVVTSPRYAVGALLLYLSGNILF